MELADNLARDDDFTFVLVFDLNLIAFVIGTLRVSYIESPTDRPVPGYFPKVFGNTFHVLDVRAYD